MFFEAKRKSILKGTFEKLVPEKEDKKPTSGKEYIVKGLCPILNSGFLREEIKPEKERLPTEIFI